ncbi:hypothetical protein AURDEDRAFT_149825 [Auricularia subglabra TFB-10046 SS5]|nr:hypothetical protein AURDEDRAFT_149825 [Auricularia subglabra TFB-10046 SS5]
MSATPTQVKADFGLDEEKCAWSRRTASVGNIYYVPKLQDLIASVIPLGASVAVLWSSWRMRQHLAAILSTIGAAAKQRCPGVFHLQDAKLDGDALRMILPFYVSLPTYSASGGVHTELSNLAKHIDTFFGCLQEFTGYMDGSITETVTFIRDDLRYIAERVEEAKGQSGNMTLASEVFIHDITPEIGSRLVGLKRAISSVKDGSLTSLKFTHEHAVSNFTSMAAIATFFSAVIATVLALPHNPHSSFSDALTSGCWIVALVLSISSAFHSVWAASWQQAVYRFPNPRLVCFAISSQPKWVVVAVTLVLGLCTIGFTVCAAWFMLELTAYFRYKLTLDMKGEFHADLWSFIGVKWRSLPTPHLVADDLVVQLPTEATDSQAVLPRTPSQDSAGPKKLPLYVRIIIGLLRAHKRHQNAGAPVPLVLRDSQLWNAEAAPTLFSADQVQSVQAVKMLNITTAQYFPIRTVGFSPDRRYLTSSSFDGNAHVFALPIAKGLRTTYLVPGRTQGGRTTRAQGPALPVAFLSVEDTQAVKLSNTGEELECYKIKDTIMHVAHVLHGGHIIFLGAAMRNRMPSTACAQQYIIVYDPQAEAHRREFIKIPIAQKTVELTLSVDRKLVLVSYEGKTPPQLWHFRFDAEAGVHRLTRTRSFISAHDEPFAGPCTLSGKNDEYVLGASRKAERDSSGISCISGSRFHDGCTFATGSLDGTVSWWQGVEPDPGSMRTDHTMTVPLPPFGEGLGLTGVETSSPSLIAADIHDQSDEALAAPASGLSS